MDTNDQGKTIEPNQDLQKDPNSGQNSNQPEDSENIKQNQQKCIAEVEDKIKQLNVSSTEQSSPKQQAKETESKQKVQQHNSDEDQEVSISSSEEGESSDHENENNHNQFHSDQQHEQQPEQPGKKNYQTKQFVEINRSQIAFGKNVLFPGSIQEIDVSIGLRQDVLEQSMLNNALMLRVIAKCDSTQFDELDQYVYSVRSNQRFQYFEEVRFKIRRKEKAQVKVAVKIPPVGQNYTILGHLQIQLQGLDPVNLPIIAKSQVPKIQCIKNLYKPDEDTDMIKIPAKKNQPRMPPIPFKNLSNFNFTVQVEAISTQSFADRPYDIITQNFVNCQANTQFFVNTQLRQNLNFTGQKPSRQIIRKILILKIKNSSLYFHYPIQVQVFESSNTSSMS